MAGSEIHDSGRNKERGDAARTALHQLDMFALDDVETTDTGGNVHANFVEVRVFLFPTGHLDGKIRAGQGHLDKAAHFFQFFFFNPAERIEIFYFAADLAVEARGIKQRDRTHAALTRDEGRPTLLRAGAQRADQSNARHNYTASQLFGAPC